MFIAVGEHPKPPHFLRRMQQRLGRRDIKLHGNRPCFKPHIRRGAEAEQFFLAAERDLAERMGLESLWRTRRSDGNIWTKPEARVQRLLCDNLITMANRCNSRASHLYLGLNAESDVRWYIFNWGGGGGLDVAWARALQRFSGLL